MGLLVANHLLFNLLLFKSYVFNVIESVLMVRKDEWKVTFSK